MENVIQALQNQLVCTAQQAIGCTKNCQHCDLLVEDANIMAAYNMAIEALKDKIEPQEYITPKDPRRPEFHR